MHSSYNSNTNHTMVCAIVAFNVLHHFLMLGIKVSAPYNVEDQSDDLLLIKCVYD